MRCKIAGLKAAEFCYAKFLFGLSGQPFDCDFAFAGS